MTLLKYDIEWVGIDGGREGLWREPLWHDVLRILSRHEGESVYDEESPIYDELARAYPYEAWRSYTDTGNFRPLFRDYPHPWTRSGAIDLHSRIFQVTDLGHKVLKGELSKNHLLMRMFNAHSEKALPPHRREYPFSILACAFAAACRPLSIDEVYWGIMKNFRPRHDHLDDVLRLRVPLLRTRTMAPTPRRRLRNMLSLLRSAGALRSVRRGPVHLWLPDERPLLAQIARRSVQ